MKGQLLSIFCLLFILNWCQAQQPVCDCSANLEKLIAKTEENYAGYPVKVTDHTQSQYKKLVDSLRQVAEREQYSKTCYYILKKYIRFFRDKHFILNYYNPDDYDSETVPYTASDLQQYVKTHPSTLHPLEGIWLSPDSSLEFFIRRFPDNSFKGIVLRSSDPKLKEGMVYITLTPSKNGFLAKRYNSFISTDVTARQRGNLLQVWNMELYGKTYPQKMSVKEEKEWLTWRDNNRGLRFEALSKKTAYLKVPSFENNDDKIMALVSKNDSLIRSSENLIVDLTGNGGGNTGWVAFISYFMTNPIVQASSFVRVTPDNTKLKLEDLKGFATNPIPDEYKKYFPDPVLAAYKKAYQELPDTKLAFYPIPGVTFPLDSITINPKRIALVVDELCGSSTEYFFFISRQSKKTTTYGTNTIGMMDYEGMSVPTALPYDKFIVTIPIVRSSWTQKNPIDDKGFSPQVHLDAINRLEWIDYIKERLELKKGK